MITRRLFLAGLGTLVASSAARAQAVSGDDAPLRFGRFEHEGSVWYGFLGAGGIQELDRNFLDHDVRMTGRAFQPQEVKLLAPVVPSKVIGIAANYKSNEGEKPPEPKFFAKLPSAVIGPDEEIVPPPGSSSLHYEGEMVVVIGARASKVSEAEAPHHIMGVTAGNDVTERGYPFHPFDVLRAKGSDTMAPLGPWIVPGLAYDQLKLRTRLNGEVVQESSTADMVHDVARIVSAVSQYITLEPGDLIYTGTPGITKAMKPGDVVEVELEGVGVLKNKVAGGQ